MSTLSADTALIQDRMNGLIKAIIRKFEKQYPTRYGYLDYAIERGTKYYKIVEITNANETRPSRSVHAFVSRQTGAVYKPASWKAPAAHVRYQLLDDASYEACLHNADFAGSYLYMR
jgi:hypothetical protein